MYLKMNMKEHLISQAKCIQNGGKNNEISLFLVVKLCGQLLRDTYARNRLQ